jgi:hypothetical protein
MRWGDEPRLQRALDKLAAVTNVLIHGTNNYSWLLARLCSEVAHTYIRTSLRHQVNQSMQSTDEKGQLAFDRYLRQSYQARKSLAWPSQTQGIERLATGGSFALCTPTASGKTTIAEIAILQSLFTSTTSSSSQADERFVTPLAIYLVPTRALAAEVESKLSRVLSRIRIESRPIKVTGLYGGTDWGPTDAWLTAAEPTVLICTYEKAEALLRFLGVVFVRRVSLVVIDEAHSIQCKEDASSLRSGEARSLRLESLVARLLAYLDRSTSRVIALSAVASGIDVALASWITGQQGSAPVRTTYRSTRQLVGRIECLPNRTFDIRYDQMDGHPLQFEAGDHTDSPYIPNPFPPHPPVSPKDFNGPEKSIRPYLFWAAMHLASPDESGQQHAVLISVTQHIGAYADDFIKLLETVWPAEAIPPFFSVPEEPEKREIWDRCLRSCVDYFGTQSREYKLLERGIVVHHGKMPGLLARFLIEVVNEQIVHLVMATSTLSEGVNLPVETVLIPSLHRSSTAITTREFANLIGRAGRPGFGTEGRSLVVLPSAALERRRNRTRDAYHGLVSSLQDMPREDAGALAPRSPLVELIRDLWQQWRRLSGSSSTEQFADWIETATPLAEGDDPIEQGEELAMQALDALDSFLLSAIVELDQISGADLVGSELEDRLRAIWQQTYARYVHDREAALASLFIRRGRALKETVYSDAAQRRRLYRTSLPPRSGNQVLRLQSSIVTLLERGSDYAVWDVVRRFDYVRDVVAMLGSVPAFNLGPKTGNIKIDWQDVLRWWLDPSGAPTMPTDKQIALWHAYVSQNFSYRFNWGLGTVIGLAFESLYERGITVASLDDWPRTGLPWIVFWIKELVVWGTLEPVAAYLLASGMEVTRSDAELAAQEYYVGQASPRDCNELLNAATIRNWTSVYSGRRRQVHVVRPPDQVRATLMREFLASDADREWRVVPMIRGGEIYWLDPAGFPLAKCDIPAGWKDFYLDSYDFALSPRHSSVFSRPYL